MPALPISPPCVVAGVVHFFGRLSFLVDENAHAVHFFISALLQLLDRCGGAGAGAGARAAIAPAGQVARFVTGTHTTALVLSVGSQSTAWHCFVRLSTALLRLCPLAPCRFGSLYGELARFVLRLLGFKPKDKKAAAQEGPPGTQPQQPGMPGPAAAPGHPAAKQRSLPGLPGAPARPVAGAAAASGGGQWDSLWRKDA